MYENLIGPRYRVYYYNRVLLENRKIELKSKEFYNNILMNIGRNTLREVREELTTIKNSDHLEVFDVVEMFETSIMEQVCETV